MWELYCVGGAIDEIRRWYDPFIHIGVGGGLGNSIVDESSDCNTVMANHKPRVSCMWKSRDACDGRIRELHMELATLAYAVYSMHP